MRFTFAPLLRAMLAAAGALFVSVATGAAPATRPAAAKGPSGIELRRDVYEFNRDSLSRVYGKGQASPAAWDADARAYLDVMASYFTDGSVPPIHAEPGDRRVLLARLSKDAEALAAAGCKDPLVFYCYAALLEDDERTDEALPHARDAARRLCASDYAPGRQWAAARRFARLAATSVDHVEGERLADGLVWGCTHEIHGRMLQNRRRLRLSGPGVVQHPEHKTTGSFDFVFRRDEPTISLTIDKQPLVDKLPITVCFHGFRVGFATNSGRPVRFADLRMRRLTDPPPAAAPKQTIE